MSIPVSSFCYQQCSLLLSVCTGPWKPGKSWNLKIWIPGLESPGIFVEVLESPGLWTYRCIFLIISVQEFSHYTSSKIWVYLCTLNLTLEGPGKSWNLRCQNVYEPCYCVNDENINIIWICFSADGLDSDREYEFRVRAKNKAGLGEPSSGSGEVQPRAKASKSEQSWWSCKQICLICHNYVTEDIQFNR